MTRQAWVGLFTIVTFILILGVFYVLADFGTRARGYRIIAHFQSASGLHTAALVYLSGVPIGAVDDISLEPDFTTRVTIAVKPGYAIPEGSRFIIQAPITGEPTVLITPPKQVTANTPTLVPGALVEGTNPVTFADLLQQGQGEVRRLDNILAQLEASTPDLLRTLQSTLKNANQLTTSANTSVQSLSARTAALEDAMSHQLNTAGSNIVDLTGTLDATVRRNSGEIDALLAQLNRTSKSFGETIDSLKEVATDPKVKRNLVDTTASFALTAKTFAALTTDLRQVTGSPQTQAQLRDTVANIDATAQKVDSLLRSLGGSSSVYGVDKGATPAPGGITPPPAGYVPTSAPAIPPSAAPGAGGTPPPSSAATSPPSLANLRERISKFTKDLVQLQVRVAQLAPQRPASAARNTSPLLTSDRGPQTDFNLSVLPRGGTSLFTGVNDVGQNATANFMLVKNAGPVRLAGGMEYSRLGGSFSYAWSKVGLESRFYDLRHPTADFYGNFFVAPKFQIFGGVRDASHAARRAVFGVQAEM